MTINIALKTRDALVLGCDSIASTVGYYIDPFKIGYETDSAGDPVQDADGKMTLKFDFDDLEMPVTDSWVGVTKMFQIHPLPAPMVAVTSGPAILNERSIANLASDFLTKCGARPDKLEKTSDICDEFLHFFREQYDRHYKDSTLPESAREGPNFLVGGYGRDDLFPRIFRMNVQLSAVVEALPNSRGALVWGGQSDAVERFLRGYDTDLQKEINTQIKVQLREYAEKVKTTVAEAVNRLLDLLQQSAPSTWTLDIVDPVVKDLDWDAFKYHLNYSSMPEQEAIDFVAFLVNLQAGKGRFARGVPTVGGRTHIGVIRKDRFEIVNPAKLTHRHTGVGDDTQ